MVVDGVAVDAVAGEEGVVGEGVEVVVVADGAGALAEVASSFCCLSYLSMVACENDDDRRRKGLRL